MKKEGTVEGGLGGGGEHRVRIVKTGFLEAMGPCGSRGSREEGISEEADEV